MPQNLGADHPLKTPSTTQTLSSSAGPVNISFSFINDADVLVFLGGTLRTNGTGSDNYTINTAKTQVTFNNTVSGDVIITRKSDLLNKVRTFTPGSSVRAADLNTQFDQVMQLIQDNYELLRSVVLNDANDEITVGRDSIIANDKVRTESIQDNAVTTSKIAAGNANQVLITSGGEPTWSDNVDVQGTLDVTSTTTLDGALNVAGNTDLNGTLDVDGNTELDDVNVSGTLDVAGNSTFDGDVDLGNSAADTITITGEVDSNIVPSTDGSRDLGSSTKRWNEVHADNIQATTLSDGARVTASEQVAHSPNDTTYYTTSAADQRFWRQDAAGNEIIQTSATWTADDSRVATTGAIDARIVNLVTEVGGFVPIANETSFPATNPDINDGAGTIVSIGALASDLTFNSSGQATITDGAGSGNNVTITGGPASTTIASNSGALVETTTTLHTYTWHRTTPDGANVNTVANSIANVNTVAANIGDVNTLEDNITDIQTLADIEDGTVATDAISNLGNIHANVTTCADNIADINTVANDLNEDTSEIETVAASITNVDAVGGSITNVNTVATNINNVNSFSQTYQVSNSAPTSPDAGDLWWDTSQDPQLLKAYDETNTQWIAVTTDQEAGLQTSGGTMTGALALEELGSQTAPTLTFDGDSNTGLFRGTADNVNVTTGGTTRLNINNTGLKATKPVEVEVTTATTNAVTTALTVESQSSGTPAAGIGVGMDFAVETAASNVEIGAQVEAVTTDVTSTAEDVDLVVNLMEGGTAAAEKFRIASDGDVTAQGNIASVGGTYTTSSDTNLTLDPAGSGKIAFGANVTGNVTFEDNIDLQDNDKILLGTGDDTELFFDGTNTILDHTSTSGTLILRSDAVSITTTDATPENYIVCSKDGLVRLYHNNSGKIETTSTGVDVTGTTSTDRLVVEDDGSSSPVAIIKSDDANPWALVVKNDTYSTNEAHGLNFFQSDGGNVTIRNVGDGEHTTLSINSNNGSTTNTGIVLGTSGQVTLGHGTDSKLQTTATGVQINDAGNLILQNDDTNATVSINADDCTASYTVTLPPTAPTADLQVLRVNSGTTDAELEWGTISSDVLSTDITQTASRSFASNQNHMMVGPITLNSSVEFTIGSGSKLVILN